MNKKNIPTDLDILKFVQRSGFVKMDGTVKKLLDEEIKKEESKQNNGGIEK